MIIFDKSQLPHTQQQDINFTITQLLYTLTNNPGRCIFMLKASLCCGLFLRLVRYPQVFGWSLNGFMSPWQTVSCKSPHNQLVRLAMDLAALCDMWCWKCTNWCHLAVFSFDRGFVWCTLHGSPSIPIEFLTVLAKLVKKLSKMMMVNLPIAIHSTVGPWIGYKQL